MGLDIVLGLVCENYTNLAGLSVCAECLHLRGWWRESLTRASGPCLHLEAIYLSIDSHHGLNLDVLRRRRTRCRLK